MVVTWVRGSAPGDRALRGLGMSIRFEIGSSEFFSVFVLETKLLRFALDEDHADLPRVDLPVMSSADEREVRDRGAPAVSEPDDVMNLTPPRRRIAVGNDAVPVPDHDRVPQRPGRGPFGTADVENLVLLAQDGPVHVGSAAELGERFGGNRLIEEEVMRAGAGGELFGGDDEGDLGP